MGLIITPLDAHHDRAAFDCGVLSLNHYLHRYARQDVRRRFGRVFVAVSSGEPERVLGYYSLSAGSLGGGELPEVQRRRLPRYPVPVALLGRLAVAVERQGEGLGGVLLANALERVFEASQVMAVYAVVVDALDERAAGFYRRFGFLSLPSRPLRLFLPLESVREMVR